MKSKNQQGCGVTGTEILDDRPEDPAGAWGMKVTNDNFGIQLTKECSDGPNQQQFDRQPFSCPSIAEVQTDLLAAARPQRVDETPYNYRGGRIGHWKTR